MLNFTSEDGMQEKPEDSLAKAVEDVSQHGYAQTEALKEKQETLQGLQSTLSQVEMKGELAEQRLRSKEREILMLESEMDELDQQIKVLHDSCFAIRKENTELQLVISKAEEKVCLSSAQFITYWKKMKGHIAAVKQAASQTEAHKELEEKKELVRMLGLKKKELEEDLENPNGNTVQMAKHEINNLKEEVSAKTETVAEKREQLREEFETQKEIKKNLQIQNRRFEAIVRRLHCQLSRVQAVHRQMAEDVQHMERELAWLREQLESLQDTEAKCC